ncbi:hypothetical protein [Chitinolyticbacter albus]|uniref:hypothetical protein n=1 Tax=Chitinolyticbacter albus TaxID=2961951 RepID=UPI00210B7CA6|nr:hypothetical protein [Chitinolyticbacter albus]
MDYSKNLDVGISDSRKVFLLMYEGDLNTKILSSSLPEIYSNLTGEGLISSSYESFKNYVYSSRKKLGLDNKLLDISLAPLIENPNSMKVIENLLLNNDLNTTIIIKSPSVVYGDLMKNKLISCNYDYFKLCIHKLRKRYGLPSRLSQINLKVGKEVVIVVEKAVVTSKNKDLSNGVAPSSKGSLKTVATGTSGNMGDVRNVHEMYVGEVMQDKYDLTFKKDEFNRFLPNNDDEIFSCSKYMETDLGLSSWVKYYQENMNNPRFVNVYEFLNSPEKIPLTDSLILEIGQFTDNGKISFQSCESNSRRFPNLKKYKVFTKFNLHYLRLMMFPKLFDQFKTAYNNS